MHSLHQIDAVQISHGPKAVEVPMACRIVYGRVEHAGKHSYKEVHDAYIQIDRQCIKEVGTAQTPYLSLHISSWSSVQSCSSLRSHLSTAA